MMIFNRLTTVAVAAAIALTGFAATPVVADDSGREQHRPYPKTSPYSGPWGTWRPWQPDVSKPRPYVGHYRTALPLECVRWTSNHKGQYRALGRRCIKQRTGITDLPQHCERTLYSTRGKPYTGYGRRCLLRSGYKITSFGH